MLMGIEPCVGHAVALELDLEIVFSLSVGVLPHTQLSAKHSELVVDSTMFMLCTSMRRMGVGYIEEVDCVRGLPCVWKSSLTW